MAELDPLYTAEEMRAAEAGHDVDTMMQRAGAAVADELMRRFPDALRIALRAGGGANGGDGRIAGELLRGQGRELVEERPDVVIDALLGTGLKGAPREETSRLIEEINGAGVPVLAVDIPSGVNASTGEVAGAAVRAVGPGLGREKESKALVRRLLAEVAVPAVVDADALFELEPGEWPAPRVLTPHEGELARLLGRESKEVAAHRLASVQEAAERFNCVAVLQ